MREWSPESNKRTLPKSSENTDRSHSLATRELSIIVTVSTAGTSGGTAAHAYLCHPNNPFFLQDYWF